MRFLEEMADNGLAFRSEKKRGEGSPSPRNIESCVSVRRTAHEVRLSFLRTSVACETHGERDASSEAQWLPKREYGEQQLNRV